MAQNLGRSCEGIGSFCGGGALRLKASESCGRGGSCPLLDEVHRTSDQTSQRDSGFSLLIR